MVISDDEEGGLLSPSTESDNESELGDGSEQGEDESAENGSKNKRAREHRARGSEHQSQQKREGEQM